jgi:hypothetical protein|tara:strand:+ start:209 stop:415 length:207 start_codon:yes stop_codon:yes gene_type:complete
MASVFLIILHLATGDVYKVPVGMLAKKVSCHKALEQIVTFDESKTSIFYQGKEILGYYCKDGDGRWIP